MDLGNFFSPRDAFTHISSLFSVLFAGDKPHGCDICLKKFALACNLRAHMKTHEGMSRSAHIFQSLERRRKYFDACEPIKGLARFRLSCFDHKKREKRDIELLSVL
jgi:uncharacterized Zn-finger protein